MSDTARDYQTIDAVSTEGLENFFDEAQVTGAMEPVALVEEPITGASEQLSGVPVERAAKLLGTSTNALKKRLRKGSLSGYKVESKHGEKWFVNPEALSISEPVSVDLEPVPVIIAAPVPDAEEPVTCAVEPVPTSAREPVACALEPVPTSATTSELLAKLRAMEVKLEGATYRNGYLEAENEGLKVLLGAKDSHIKLLTDSQHKPGWWARFSSWFFRSR